MKVTVRYFAICRQMFNRDEENIDLPEGAILQDVLDQLKEEKPEISELFETMQIGNMLTMKRNSQITTRLR